VPWSATTKDNGDINKAREILEEGHYGLKKVKKRILEYLAIKKLKNDMGGPILCFVGPPGVGKTSIGKAVAEALDRKFARISLWGVRDEAEIRVHRITYVGALPGRIIQGIKKAGSNNPVVLLDEIDKVGYDYRGDPSSALLEVLDPEQNSTFSDHYLEVPFDLSKTLFITTANRLDTIPSPLKDRMEIIDFPGYTQEEKLMIAKKHLLPRQTKRHGLPEDQLFFEDEAVVAIIENYTREAGVRNLEREIATVLRGVGCKIAEGSKGKIDVRSEDLTEYLGPRKFYAEVKERTMNPGVSTGLAWTPTGGEILFIESNIMPGKKGLILTGQMGDVMKESAQAAMSYVKGHAEELGIDKESFKDKDIHIHVPAGAIPKDGPSAGVAITTALVSLLKNQTVKNDIAMTGEITLKGKVLPVGGIKEKALGARRAGIDTIYLPRRNEKDLSEIPDEIKKEMKFIFADNIDQILTGAFVGELRN
jgi:ATP-dependent Lon protease